jgi:asparagine synthase (glutamine-hydrolysing)
MKRIAGLFHRDGRTPRRADAERLIRSTPAPRFRNEATLSTGPVAFAASSHAAFEASVARSADGDLMLVADARIDNREELCALLGVPRTAHGISDDYIIIAAYQRWGIDSPSRLIGDFSFVLYDAREDRIFCARDPFGVRPFYYHASPRLFLFASDITALTEHSQVSRRLDDRRIAGYLTGILDDTEATFYNDIRRLPPAHALTVTRDSMRLHRYWSPDAEHELKLSSDEEYAEGFRELFTEAVRCRMNDRGPAGAFLSGGLDSSSIVCTARQIDRRKGNDRVLHTFSGLFPGVPDCDERRFIDAVVAGGDIQPHYLDASATSPMSGLEELLAHHGEPFFSPNLFVHDGLFAMAGRLGVQVMLDGFDGDTVVSHGTGHLSDLARRGKWREFMAEVNGMAQNFSIPKRRIIWRRGVKELLPSAVRYPSLVARRREARARVASMLASDFARSTHWLDLATHTVHERSQPAQSARHDHAGRLMSGVIPFTLEVLDRTASRHGIEPRYPFFDRRLVEYCLSLPGEQKVRNGWTRWIMRQGLGEILPEEILRRGGKAMPGGSFARNLLAFERERLDALILQQRNELAEYLNIETLKQTYRRYQETKGIGDALDVWRSVTFAIWLRRRAGEEENALG